jgi:hypothetical protein
LWLGQLFWSRGTQSRIVFIATANIGIIQRRAMWIVFGFYCAGETER